jgi:hypothetical protein
MRFPFAIRLLLLFGVSVASAGEPKPPADIVVMDSDLFALAPEKIKEASVMMTVVGGKVIYERK